MAKPSTLATGRAVVGAQVGLDAGGADPAAVLGERGAAGRHVDDLLAAHVGRVVVHQGLVAAGAEVINAVIGDLHQNKMPVKAAVTDLIARANPILAGA